jgi:hypothetical protein
MGIEARDGGEMLGEPVCPGSRGLDLGEAVVVAGGPGWGSAWAFDRGLVPWRRRKGRGLIFPLPSLTWLFLSFLSPRAAFGAPPGWLSAGLGADRRAAAPSARTRRGSWGRPADGAFLRASRGPSSFLFCRCGAVN